MANYKEILNNELNLIEKEPNKFYGVVDGYEVSVANSITSSEGFVIHVNFYAGETAKINIVNAFVNHEGSAFAKGFITPFGVRLTLNGWTTLAAAKKLVVKLKYIIQLLKTSNINGITHSPLSGKEIVNPSLVGVNEGFVTIEQEDADKIRMSFEKQKEAEEKAPNNYLRGFIGSILGGVVGAIAYVVLYFIGIISAWIGVLSVFLSGLLYKKFGGKEKIFTYVISGVISFAIVMIACVVVCNVDVMLALEYQGLNMTVQEALETFPEISEIFYGNIISTLIYTLLGVVVQVIYSARKVTSRKNSIR